MREILFKAKAVGGSWIEGDLIRYQNGQAAIVEVPFSKYGCEATEIVKRTEVIPGTICQYTGLTDKNGNKIWENDIVKHYNNPNEPSRYVIGAIYWNEDNVRYERTSEYQHCKFSVLYDCVYEVIGNIFDNPELLEGGAE